MDTLLNWYVWAYGKKLCDMTDREIAVYMQRAWDTNDGQQLRDFRAEASRRGMTVV